MRLSAPARKAPAAPAPAAPETSRSLGGSFWWFWSASTLSSAGNGMLTVSLPLLAAAGTRDPVLVSLILLAQRSPWLLFGLPLGALADRLPSRPLLIGSDLVRMSVLLVVGLLALGSGLGMPVLLLGAFVIGTGTVVFDTTSQAWLPRTVPGPSLGRANGYLSAGNQADPMLGPALGGLALAATPALPVLADAATFGGSALLLRRCARERPLTRPAAGRRVRDDIRSGLRHLRHDRFVALLALTVTALAGLQAGALAVQVLVGLRVFGLGAAEYGLFVGAAAIGGLTGAIIAGRLAGPRRIGLLLTGILAATAGYIGMAATSDPWIGGAALAVEQFGVGMVNVTIATLRMGAVPVHLQGRITSVFRMLLHAAVSGGALLGGVVAKAFGLQAPFLLAAAGYVLLVLLVVPWLFALAPQRPGR